jgi:hypothetical protein
MEQPCYKCGQTVDEGVPFCPHCAAPQIRVVIAEPVPDPAAYTDGAPRSQGYAALPASQTVPVLAVPMQWSRAFRPCALAALIAALAMVLKLMVPLIAVLGAGFLAVGFHRRSSPELAIHAGAGARLGALSGLFCFGMTAILEAAAVAVFHKGDEIRKFMLDAIQQTASRLPDPQYQPTLDLMRSPTGLVLLMVFLMIVVLLTFLLLGTLGGALGGAILSRRNRT